MFTRKQKVARVQRTKLTKKRVKKKESLSDEEILHSEISPGEEELEDDFERSQHESNSEMPQTDNSGGESDSMGGNEDVTPKKMNSKVETIIQTYQRAILQIQNSQLIQVIALLLYLIKISTTFYEVFFSK